MTKPVTNFAAFARARLLIATNKRKGDFQLMLQRYTAERFLYRLGVSAHRNRFVLKGAMLFVLWDDAAIPSVTGALNFTTETRRTLRFTEIIVSTVKSPCPPCLRGEKRARPFLPATPL